MPSVMQWCVPWQEGWYEKLQRWDEALEAYEKKARAAPTGSAVWVEAALGRLRCLAALAEWDRLSALTREEWFRVDPQVRAIDPPCC